MGDLSPHFDSSEFADSRTGERHAINPQLVAALEKLRSTVGRPLPIVSGFRSVETNRNVGGAPHSNHLTGDAADIPAGLATVAQARDSGAVGIGYRGRWVVHIDVRPGPVVLFPDCLWSGAGR